MGSGLMYVDPLLLLAHLCAEITPQFYWGKKKL